MGVRKTGRKLAMQILYQVDVRNEDINDVISLFFKQSKFQEETKDWAILLSKSAWEKKDDLDKKIKLYAIDWDINRMNKVDISILRLAFYELCYTDTAAQIVVNEAVELAKKYSADESPKFINGILGAYVNKDIDE